MAELTLKELQERLRSFRDERDWERFHTPRDLAAAIAIEAGELQEVLLWTRDENAQSVLLERRERLEEEIADVVIQCANLASVAGIDLGVAIERKIELNAEKYPVGKSKGSSTKYTDL